MSRINTPINQVRLTNVATVRITKGGKRFEIACYRNKVVNYRQGIETDLSEVLQTERVFTNVSKGEFAKSKDLQKVFGTSDEEEVLKIILEKGDLQVSDLERTQQYESIRQAMKQAEYSIHPTRTVKKQYLDCFKRIQEKEVIDIVRAKMKLQLFYPKDAEMEVKACFDEHSIQPIEVGGTDDSPVSTLFLDPSLYRVLEDLSKHVNGRMEILQQVVMREGDSNIEEEMRENKNQEQQRSEDATIEEAGEIYQQLGIQRNVDDKFVPNTIGQTEPEKVDDDDDDDEDYMTSGSSRKNQKKAQKKSKKSKRREKEEADERQARIDMEAKRREERAEKMGKASASNMNGEVSTNGGAATKSCNTCGGAFAKMNDYRAHFRSDWHRYNVKLKMTGASPVSEEEFRLCDSDAFFDGV